MATAKLTAIAVQKAKSKDRDYRIADGAGLSLLIRPNGSKIWQSRYQSAGLTRYAHRNRPILPDFDSVSGLGHDCQRE